MLEAPHILLLAGTTEARLLATKLQSRLPNILLTLSFAGAVKNLPSLAKRQRVGGFGGAEGLARYLEEEHVDLLIDATHPFAVQISSNALVAATKAQLPLLRLERAEWKSQTGDLWTEVETLRSAKDLLPAGCRAFLAIGRQELGIFAERIDLWALARMIEPPADGLLPREWKVLLAPPAKSVDEEVALMRVEAITHLVTKNSGGTRSAAKLEAARRLHLPVVMVRRPHLPDAPTCSSIDEALAVIEEQFSR